MMHPLITEGVSPHYDETEDQDSAIYTFEKNYTINELLAWATLTKKKYEYRADRKGQKEQDLVKRKAFQRYITALNSYKMEGFGDMRAVLAYKYIGTKYRYKKKIKKGF